MRRKARLGFSESRAAPLKLRSQHSSRADVELVLNFLRDPIAVRKEFLAIAGSAKAEELPG